jgi:desulfoferrodoxin-like iron-binding protein
MVVEKTGERYRCSECGNEVIVLEAGGGTLVCCDKDMEKVQ